MNQDKAAKKLRSIHQHFSEPGLKGWHDLARKELGSGKPMDSLLWKIEEDIIIDPLPQPKAGHRTHKSLSTDQKWQLAESYRFPLSARDQNTIVAKELGEVMLIPGEIDLPGLSSVDAPHDNSSLMLKRIKPTEIDLIPSWLRFVKIEELDPVDFQFLKHANFKWRYATADHAAAPSFQIAEIVERLIIFLSHDVKKSITPGRYRIYIGIGDQYLIEIAKIRALKLVMYNLWQTLGLEASTLPAIYGEVTATEQDQNLDLIKSSAKSLAATIGGLDFLYFSAGPLSEQSAEYSRLKRNIHYILKYESQVHYRLDPLAGSHLIEEMTQKIAGKAWDKIRGKG